MKIYVLLILNILFIIPSFSQDRLLPAYTAPEQNQTDSTVNQIHSNGINAINIESQHEDMGSKILASETLTHTSIADTIPWGKIDLTSPQMKQKAGKAFRWWIPITIAGAAIGITTTALIFSRETEEPPLPNFMPFNDQFTVPCKSNSTISPLNNDIGGGLRITAVTGAPAGWISFTEQTITILETATQNFSFTYTVMDSSGLQGDAIVSIIFELSPIQLQNQSFQGSPGDLITHQIFANAICSECIVASATVMPFTGFTWTPQGLFSFELPEVPQTQTFQFTFTVTDRCSQTATVQISVTVRPDCDIEPSFIVSNEECDFADGSVEIVIGPISNYKFEWSNGMNSSVISGLSGGIYSLTLSLISDPTCFEVFEIEVLSEVPSIELMDDRYQTVANVLFTGNVLNNDQGTSLTVTNFEDLDVSEFSIQPNGSFRFLADEDADEQYTSIYTVTDKCGNTSTAIVIFDVVKLPCDFVAIVSTSPADCGKSNGAASVSITPAGASYQIAWPNGMTGTSALGFAPGTYTLIITNTADNCVLNFNFSIAEKPAPEYIQFIETTAATCVGGAQVNLVLNDPSGSTMQLTVTRANLPFLSMNVNSGPINLGEIANFLPGNYRISVSCQGCPARCAQILDITIAQVSLLLELNDDVANIPANTVWNGNVLTNDFGLGMNVIGFTQPSAGTAFVSTDGSATYNPPADFSGSVSFFYTVRDTCGQEKNGTVTINVEAVPCDFTVQFSNEPTECGIMNGSSTLIISPPGNAYEVIWSNGAQGLMNTMLMAGNYSVTVSIANSECTQMFSTSISELPPLELIQQISVDPATCVGGGSVSFTIFNPKDVDIVVDIYLGNQYIMSATIAAGGTFSEQIESLPEGFYLLQALESGSLRRCADTETFEVELIDLEMQLNNDNYNIGFGTVWNGNVFINDIGTGLQVNGFTQSPNGIVQVLSNGNGLFIPSPGFTGLATFQYFAVDTCNQEQMATVFIFVLPFGSDNNDNISVNHEVEFFQQGLNPINTSFQNSIPEGFSSQFILSSPAFQNGLRYTLLREKWLFRTEFSYGEASASDGQNQILYQNNFQTRVGVGWFHDFNGNRIITESGFAAASNKTVFSNSLSSTLSRHSLQAFYFKAEYQIKLQSAYCIFWEPQIFYFPGSKSFTGMVSTGFKYAFNKR